MMRRVLLARGVLVVVLLFGIVTTGFAAGQAEGDASRVSKEYTIRVGVANASSHYHSKAAERFGEIVENETNGAISVEVFPAQQLGSETEVMSLVEEGTVQMFLASPGNVGNYVSEFQIMLCPYIWRDYDHLEKTMDGEIGKEMGQKLLDAHGIRMLDALWVNGARHLSTSKTPVQTPADLKGLKVRASTSPIYIAAVEILGANPVPIDFAELYLALQQGVVEGEENALGTIDAQKFYEVQNYIMLTGHIYQSQIVGINDEFYSSLPSDYQKIIDDAILEARNYNNELQLKADVEAIAKFKKLGINIIEPDIEAFRNNAVGVGERLQNLWKDPNLYDRITSVQ